MLQLRLKSSTLEHNLNPGGEVPVVLQLKTVQVLIEGDSAFDPDTDGTHGDTGADETINPLAAIVVRVGIRHGRGHEASHHIHAVAIIEGLLDLIVLAIDAISKTIYLGKYPLHFWKFYHGVAPSNNVANCRRAHPRNFPRTASLAS